jgi:hypothetical protein
MKKRVSILIEEEVIRHAKRRAAEEGRSLSDLTQDALVSYLSGKVSDPRKREGAYQLFCEQPMRLSRKQFNEILKEENFKPD